MRPKTEEFFVISSMQFAKNATHCPFITQIIILVELFWNFTQTHTDTDRHTQTHTDTDRHTQTQTDTHRHRQTHRYTHTDTLTQTRAHTHTHTHTRTPYGNALHRSTNVPYLLGGGMACGTSLIRVVISG